jgi:hypothetical protein
VKLRLVIMKSLLITDTVDVYVEIVKFFKVYRKEYRVFNFWNVSIFRDMKKLILKAFHVLIKLDFYTVPLFDINILCDIFNYACYFSSRQNNLIYLRLFSDIL